MNINKLRAYTLYYFTLAQSEKRFLPWSKISRLLQWEDVGVENIQCVLSLLPDEIDFDWTEEGLSICKDTQINLSPTESKPTHDSIRSIFKYWREQTGRTSRVVFSNDRKSKISARLKEGFTEEDLRSAVRGIMKSSFHCGDNDQQQSYHDIHHVFRSASHVEKFKELDKQKPNSTSSQMQNRLTAIKQRTQRGRWNHLKTTSEDQT